MHPSGKYHASVLVELEADKPTPCTDGKVAGIDLGSKDFAIVNDGVKTSNPHSALQIYYKGICKVAGGLQPLLFLILSIVL